MAKRYAMPKVKPAGRVPPKPQRTAPTNPAKAAAKHLRKR
jgi:hypothetical protein